MTNGVERSGLVAERAIRAEAQGICSGSPVVVQRPVLYGNRNALLRCELAVVSVQRIAGVCDRATDVGEVVFRSVTESR